MNQRQSSPIVRPKRRNNLSLSPGERAGVRAGSLDTNFPLGIHLSAIGKPHQSIHTLVGRFSGWHHGGLY